MDIEKHGHGRYAISSDYLVSLSEQAFERGMNVTSLLHNSGLETSVLLRQDVSIGHESFLTAIANFHNMDGNLWSALEGGRRMTLSKHGYLGYAAQHSRNLLEAADKLYRYVSTRVDFISLQRGGREDRAEVLILPRIEESPALRYICLCIMVCLETLGRQMMGSRAEQLASCITMKGPAPPTPAPPLPGNSRIVFDADRYSVSWPLEVVDFPLGSRDAELAKLADARCETALRRSLDSQTLTSRVLALLHRNTGELPSLDDIAARLNMSTATLQRRLKSEGASFQQLKDRFREDQARTLLASAMSIEQIADQLGYSDASNFAKAFKSWTGSSPSHYRQQLTSPEE
ncbi:MULTISPECIES: AraC family transcriptional regulator [Spongiibacter]|uniref:AraC family transcriptional regulator n=1 Tax=Spongiibacter TaxID=630749 RepID=UPI001B0DF7EB|nr:MULTISPECIES: AraC family transcriptional regulator [Spongiibacter]MBO6751452.1 helix-turn-helix domain-containing protein [Spongiibacter sp.]|tara:strand:- start:11387 stop:12424 length:1038 start_codon:yes stop_codon:yes gene_type:complete